MPAKAIIISLGFLTLTLPGCADYMMAKQGELAEAQTEHQKELTALLRDYRLCLEKHKGDLAAQQRECAAYQQALVAGR